MREWLTVLTCKGQVSIPAEVRRALSLKEGDKVAWILEDGVVRLAPRGSVVARTAGALKSPAPPLTAEEERAAVEGRLLRTWLGAWEGRWPRSHFSIPTSSYATCEGTTRSTRTAPRPTSRASNAAS